jgi:hypothetical protein
MNNFLYYAKTVFRALYIACAVMGLIGLSIPVFLTAIFFFGVERFVHLWLKKRVQKPKQKQYGVLIIQKHVDEKGTTPYKFDNARFQSVSDIDTILQVNKNLDVSKAPLFLLVNGEGVFKFKYLLKNPIYIAHTFKDAKTFIEQNKIA